MANSIVNTTANSIVHKVGAPDSCALRVNVGDTERVISIVGGGTLVGLGLKCKGIASVLLPVAGGLLALRGLSGHCSLYSAFGIDTSKADEPDNPNAVIPAGKGVRLEASIVIDRSAQELYEIWRGLEPLPEFMSHLREVRNVTGLRSHWVATGPFGMTVEWDAEIINDRPFELLAWKSLPDSEVDTAGSVHFEPTDDGSGTVVRVNIKYDPPAGKVGIAVAKLFGRDPQAQIRDDLLSLKAMMESSRRTERAGAKRMGW